jgi:hypothetical protein
MTERLWEAGSKVVLKKQILIDFLDDLAEIAVPQGYRVYVTSGYRSPADQARVVCNNVQNTNGGNLSVYGTKTRQIYRDNCPGNMQAIVDYETEKLRKNMERDPNYQGHGTNFALDLAVNGLSNTQKIAYKELIESLGPEVLWEKKPEHFHIWLRDYKSSRTFKRVFLRGLGVTTVGLLTFFGLKYLDSQNLLP